MANVIVVGCGRVGSQLAGMLSDDGHNVCVIDRNPQAFHNLGSDFNGSTLAGHGFDEDTLIQAGIEEADALIAVTQLDNTNMMAVEVADKLFGVPHVIARMSNPDHERAYMQLGIDYVCDTSLIAEELMAKLMSGHGNHIDALGEYEILRFSLNLQGIGKRSIRVHELEREHDVRLIAFERADGSSSSIPSSDSVLYHGDTVIACVRDSLLPVFSQFIQD